LNPKAATNSPKILQVHDRPELLSLAKQIIPSIWSWVNEVP